MNNVLLVHMLNALADLPHVIDDFRLGHGVTLGRDPLEQLAAGQADETEDREIKDNADARRIVVKGAWTVEVDTYNSKINTISSSSSNASCRLINLGWCS